MWIPPLTQFPHTPDNLNMFIICFHAGNRFELAPTWSPTNVVGRWRNFTYEELVARDKVNSDIYGLRHESLEDSANLANPDVLHDEIVSDLQSAMAQSESIADKLDHNNQVE